MINVTSHVQAWVNGTSPNYGWAQNVGNWVWIVSEAGSAQQPVLFVDYGAGGGGTPRLRRLSATWRPAARPPAASR